jgi:hypothetical protein
MILPIKFSQEKLDWDLVWPSIFFTGQSPMLDEKNDINCYLDVVGVPPVTPYHFIYS